MTVALNNLIYLLTIIIDFILKNIIFLLVFPTSFILASLMFLINFAINSIFANFVLLLTNYFVFTVIFLLIIFLEYLVVKNIAKDQKQYSLKNVFNFLVSYTLISAKGLTNKIQIICIMRRININSKQKLCYATTNKEQTKWIQQFLQMFYYQLLAFF